MRYEIGEHQVFRLPLSVRMLAEKIFEYCSSSSRSQGMFSSFALPESRNNANQSLLSFEDFNEWLK